jgi:hypothetical protein
MKSERVSNPRAPSLVEVAYRGRPAELVFASRYFRRIHGKAVVVTAGLRVGTRAGAARTGSGFFTVCGRQRLNCCHANLAIMSNTGTERQSPRNPVGGHYSSFRRLLAGCDIEQLLERPLPSHTLIRSRVNEEIVMRIEREVAFADVASVGGEL